MNKDHFAEIYHASHLPSLFSAVLCHPLFLNQIVKKKMNSQLLDVAAIDWIFDGKYVHIIKKKKK